MQIQPIQETAFVQALMTFDAMRYELLAYREQIPALKQEIARLRGIIEQLKAYESAEDIQV